MSRPHIVIIVPRGEVIRNFLYSATLDTLTASADVTLLSVVHDEAFRQRFQDRCKAIVPLKEYPERRLVGILRDGLDMAHGRWLWSEVARNRWERLDWEAKQAGLPAQLKRFVRKSLYVPFANRPGLRILSGIERAMSKRLRPTEEFLDLFRAIKPDLVFNGSHIHSKPAIQPVQAAQMLGIPTATFIFSWDNLTSQGRIMLPYDHYMVWHERMRDQLLDIYRGIIRPDQVTVTGTPQFDFHFDPKYRWSREEFCRRMGLDPARKTVLYTTSMPSIFPGEVGHLQSVIRILKSYPETHRPQLLVRVYAKDRENTFGEIKQEYAHSADVIFPATKWTIAPIFRDYPEDDDLFEYSNMLRHCSLGINGASTVSLELCMFDKPTINLGFDPQGTDLPHVLRWRRHLEFDHYRPVAESGAVLVAGSENDLAALIESALRTPNATETARKRLLLTLFGGTLDGKSGVRISQSLLSRL